MKFKSIAAILIGIFLMGAPAWAFELITAEDVRQKIIVHTDLIKTAENAIILFDSSSSMAKPFKDSGMSRYDVAKNLLMERNEYFPDLGHNIGLFLYTPWKEVYPVQKYDREKFAQALASLPEKPTGATFTAQGLRRLETILKDLQGKTSVFLYTDGSDTNLGGGRKKPAAIAEELAQKYNVCFYIISTDDDFYSSEIFKAADKFNFCSRVVSLNDFAQHPAYNSEALFTVVATKNIVTVTDQKIVGIKPKNILFNFDSNELSGDVKQRLNLLGEFLKATPEAFVALAGHTDSIGDDKYNLALSKRRVTAVTDYLETNHNIDRMRVLTFWFGDRNPAADNTTPEGRRLNRRVELVVGK